MKHYFLLLLLLIFSNPLFSQGYNPTVTRYGLEDGLSHNQINWVHKDREGILWVGANNGINRFDGKEFKMVAKENFFRVTHTQFVFEDNENDLWISSKNV